MEITIKKNQRNDYVLTSKENLDFSLLEPKVYDDNTAIIDKPLAQIKTMLFKLYGQDLIINID